jgi:carbon-monoxide dehydrogenase small subunit
VAEAEITRAITFTVNGAVTDMHVEERFSLADMLRHRLALTGTHLGCEHGVCGACTVLVDGEAIRSCLMLAVQIDGSEVTTIEGLADEDGRLNRLQQAFSDHHGLQCGFCTPGILMTLSAFLADNPAPDEGHLREALSGNICRCTGYQGIVDAVMDIVAAPAAKAGQ